MLFTLLAVAFAAPAPKPIPEPNAKPTFFTTAYTVPAVAAPVITYADDLDGHIVYADEYYEPLVYSAYAAPVVVVWKFCFYC